MQPGIINGDGYQRKAAQFKTMDGLMDVDKSLDYLRTLYLAHFFKR